MNCCSLYISYRESWSWNCWNLEENASQAEDKFSSRIEANHSYWKTSQGKIFQIALFIFNWWSVISHTPPPIPNTPSDSKHPFQWLQTPLQLIYYMYLVFWCLSFHNKITACYNIHGVNQKLHYTLVVFEKMLPNFLRGVVEFKSNTWGSILQRPRVYSGDSD